MIDKTMIENEINELSRQGFNLYLSVFKLDDELSKQLKELKNLDINALPNFQNDYDAWYTKCLNLIKNVAPFRLNDFVSLYKCNNRKNLDLSNYSISDALLGHTLSMGQRIVVKPSSIANKVKMQADIVASLKDLTSDYFYNLKIELQSNIFDSEIDSAYELLKKKFLRPAGVVAGVVLEKHLSNIVNNHNIVIRKKDPAISDYNDALKDTIGISNWRKIQYLGDLRNLCCHDKKIEPTESQVRDLIDGTKYIISNLE